MKGTALDYEILTKLTELNQEQLRFSETLKDVYGRRLDTIENELVRAKTPALAVDLRSGASFEVKAFKKFLRGGRETLSPEELKVLTVSNDPQAGYLAPPETAREIIKGVTAYSPLREIAKVRQVYREALEVPKKTASGTAIWVSETGLRTEVTGLTYGLERIAPTEMSYLAKVSLQMLEDSAFNLEQELLEEFSMAFAVLEGAAFISGDGVGKPEGLLSNPAIPHIPSGDASLIKADAVMSLPYQLKTEYTRNGYYVMNRATLGTIRLLKDATSGNYLWQPGFGGQPNLLCGYPVLECSDMPDIGAGNFPIIFGDFGRGYLIVDRIEMTVQRLVEKYAEYGQVGFLARRRVGGQVVLPEAFCKLEIAAS